MSNSFPFTKVGVVGAGSFGTALAMLLRDQKLPVTVWGHDAAHVEEVEKERANPLYLPGVQLPPELRFTAELGELAGSDLVLIVTPSKAIREVLPQLQQ